MSDGQFGAPVIGQPPVGGAGLAASQGAAQVAQAPQDQTQQPAQPAQQAAIEPPQHHNALAGVLAAIAGPDVSHTINPQTGQMTTVATPPSPGNAFRRILAGALTGMGAGAAAGAAGHPGAGILGGIGAGGSAVMARQQQLNQQDIQNQEENFKLQQSAKLAQATQAHLSAETAATTWRAISYEAEISEKQAEKLNELNSAVASNPQNKNYGTYASFDEFLQKHPEVVPNIAELQAQGRITTIPEFSADGKVKSLHVYEINPQWADETNEEPVTFSIPMGTGESQDITVPAHGMKNADIIKAQVALAEKEMQAGVGKSDRGRHVRDYLQANNLPNTAANRLLGEKDYDQQTKIAPAEVRVESTETGRAQARTDRSYQYNATQLEKEAAPIDQRAQRLSTLMDTLNQGTPAADPLVAPELLSVMAGGQASGLRMNEAEISRIVGGANNWQQLKSKALAWQADPSKPFLLLPEQRRQVRALLGVVQSRVQQKAAALQTARQKLVDAEDPTEHRQILTDLHKQLNDIDMGTAKQGAGGTLPPGAPPSLHVNPDTGAQIYWDGKAWVPWTAPTTAAPAAPR